MMSNKYLYNKIWTKVKGGQETTAPKMVENHLVRVFFRTPVAATSPTSYLPIISSLTSSCFWLFFEQKKPLETRLKHSITSYSQAMPGRQLQKKLNSTYNCVQNRSMYIYIYICVSLLAIFNSFGCNYIWNYIFFW